ncbi:MAG: ABC transporter permease [Saprospiraceae bacterium]|nr:ABC transporter permease [Saprospiraceae bacterium]
MVQYIIKRLALTIPTWWVISIVIFGLSRCASSDEVAERLRFNSESNTSNQISDAVYAQTAQELGLDKPVFYFSLQPAAFPDTFYKVVRRDERTALERMIWQYGNWPIISLYQNKVKALLSKISQNTEGEILRNNLQQLLVQSKDESILFTINELLSNSDTTSYKIDVEAIAQAYKNIKQNPQKSQLYIPRFNWSGSDNQYHAWLKRFLIGDLGYAMNGQAVIEKLKPALVMTLFLGISALFLSFLVGIPLGVSMSINRRRSVGKWLTRTVFFVYSLPIFWLAILAAMFLTTDYYGVKIFPHIGLANDVPTGLGIFQTLLWNISHLVLPILCLMLHPCVVVARQMNGAMNDILKKNYIQTAKAKGLPANRIIWHHALRNALTPIVTLLGQMIPSIFLGAFSVELIFSLQGMGQTTIDAIIGKDWTVVYAVLMLVSFIILLSHILVDILYRWINPRVQFS